MVSRRGSFVENALLVGLSRQVALRRELDMVANNLANLGTSGYKSEQMVFSEYLMPVAKAEAFPRADKTLSYVQDKKSWNDFSRGSIEQTDNPFNLAIDGDAYLVVQTPQGERYTRNGNLSLDAQGRLVTDLGMPVLTTAGPVAFAAQEGTPVISKDGTISTTEGQKGRLRLVRFDNPQTLARQGNSLWSTTPDRPAQDVAPGGARVLQGQIERSNVRPIVETTRMIEITRAYQNVSSMIEKQGEMRRTAVERLAEVPQA